MKTHSARLAKDEDPVRRLDELRAAMARFRDLFAELTACGPDQHQALVEEAEALRRALRRDLEIV